VKRLTWLTERERAVLTALMEGKSTEQIAAESFVSVCTVRSHIRQILLKLGVRSQTAAVAHAYQASLPEDERLQVLTRIRQTA
jgi:DNA-binding NarL/FixJ family response regulator